LQHGRPIRPSSTNGLGYDFIIVLDDLDYYGDVYDQTGEQAHSAKEYSSEYVRGIFF